MLLLLDLLEQALGNQHLLISDIGALASSSNKHDEIGLQQLTEHLQIPLTFISAEQLSLVADRINQHSALSLQVTGSAGVAQASALVLAEQLQHGRAQLLGDRINNACATCAIALITTPESP